MIALCATHHEKAGSFTVEHCRSLKTKMPGSDVAGNFEWMRRQIVAVVGGACYIDVPMMVQFRDEPMIWFDRDAEGHMLLSFKMATASGEPRAQMIANDWVIAGDPTDVESKPNGNFLRVKYENGDELKIEFKEWPDADKLFAAYPSLAGHTDVLNIPLVTAELTGVIAGTRIKFAPTATHVGSTVIRGLVIRNTPVGLVL
ncbi:hypothetical protein [Pseudoclavibacter sp. 8L]|uniref:hypothetical protein n=1 Tax=Pseudoclavibacter sp. 8L TaxID=2653162 RepID=UPI0012F213C3|nr:hypothetical protein [Pseudoclavibacter sp. 8L]VXB28973.1 conserved hypothetical protein [Pseudoclavibacter sp. 8L]